MSVTAAQGFVASGVHCGIRKKSRLDLSLVRSLGPATGAGMFTANRMLAAPVIVCKEHLGLAQPQAVVTNSGVANAATGERGVLDARATAAEAIEFLRPAVDASFNAISVDGECSTNDAVILLANGASGVVRTPDSDEEFAACVRTVCGALAKHIVADGEGATVLAEIAVTRAASHAEARAIAERVATSPLVKTALYGHDANWGRIAAAAGSAKFDGGFAELEPERLSVPIDG